MEEHESPMSAPRADSSAEAITRRGIIALSPFFVIMSRIMGGFFTLVGLFLIVAGVAGDFDTADGDGGGLLLTIIGVVVAALGLGIFFGGPRYARFVRRYHGAES